MHKIKFDTELIKVMSLFESVTRTKLIDCISKGDKLICLVPESEVGKAVGKQAINIRRLEQATHKKVRIIAYSEHLLSFIEYVIYPYRAKHVSEEGGIVTITPQDNTQRGYIIGRGGANLRDYEEIVKRHFDIKEIKVI